MHGEREALIGRQRCKSTPLLISTPQNASSTPQNRAASHQREQRCKGKGFSQNDAARVKNFSTSRPSSTDFSRNRLSTRGHADFWWLSETLIQFELID